MRIAHLAIMSQDAQGIKPKVGAGKGPAAALHEYHRFLDEAGDTAFYGKGGVLLVGTESVSKSFILGMLKIKEPLGPVRDKIVQLQTAIANDPYFKAVPSIQKKAKSYGYYLHAKDDPPEVRKMAFEMIASVKCSFEAVVARKIQGIYEKQHGSKDENFYADLLGHLLKNKLTAYDRLVLNISQRGSSTSHSNLTKGLDAAKRRYADKHLQEAKCGDFVFNVQNPTQEPLLNIADYFCWAVQRVFEKGETRYYEFLQDKIPVVVDLYDADNYADYKNYYGPKNRLTAANRL